MKLIVRKDPACEEPEITVRASPRDLDGILAALAFVGQTVTGKKDGEIAAVPLASVCYFETVDDRLFFCTERETYECPGRLRQMEEELAALPFARISKSVIVNLRRMRAIRPEKNSRLTAVLSNGEELVVNRQYVKSIREKLGV